MRTQIQLMKCSLDRLDLIIKKMQEASNMWRKDLESISNDQVSEKTDEDLVILSHRMKNGADTIRVYIAEHINNTVDLSSIVANSHSLFKEFGGVTKAKEEAL